MDITNTDGIIIEDKNMASERFVLFMHKSMTVAWLLYLYHL